MEEKEPPPPQDCYHYRAPLLQDADAMQAFQETWMPERYPSLVWRMMATEYSATSRLCFSLNEHGEEHELCGFIVCSKRQVITLCVALEHRRRGIAHRLLNFVMWATRAFQYPVTLQVRFSNVGAQSLYHKVGFVVTGCLLNYYVTSQPPEHAVVMAYSPHAEDQQEWQEWHRPRLGTALLELLRNAQFNPGWIDVVNLDTGTILAYPQHRNAMQTFLEQHPNSVFKQIK